MYSDFLKEAKYCFENYGSCYICERDKDYKEIIIGFICPSCGEPIHYEDYKDEEWEDEPWSYCPVCDAIFKDDW
jgi:hypothetical protein